MGLTIRHLGHQRCKRDRLERVGHHGRCICPHRLGRACQVDVLCVRTTVWQSCRRAMHEMHSRHQHWHKACKQAMLCGGLLTHQQLRWPAGCVQLRLPLAPTLADRVMGSRVELMLAALKSTSTARSASLPAACQVCGRCNRTQRGDDGGGGGRGAWWRRWRHSAHVSSCDAAGTASICFACSRPPCRAAFMRARSPAIARLLRATRAWHSQHIAPCQSPGCSGRCC